MLASIKENYNQIPVLPQFVLIAANVVPLLGVLFLGWEVAMILAIYWAETGVIGFYTILKIAKAKNVTAAAGTIESWPKTLLIPFFIIHFGIFMSAHAVFLTRFLLGGNFLVQLSFTGVLLAISFLIVSHGVSYWQNYLQNKKYKELSGHTIMGHPYKRVVVMHFVIILSAFLVTGLESDGQTVALVLLVLLKTIIDLWTHQKEHV